MTHQPPVPEGSQSPYPLHPAPIPEDVKARAAEREAEQAQAGQDSGPSQATVFGIGAALALGAAAALGGMLYARRASSDPKPKRGGAKKRKSGKAKTSRKTATGETKH